MEFEQNLFISYAHIDNQPVPPAEQGWITQFHETLNALLSMRLGKTAKIWRDQKLQGNDVFDAEIVTQFSSSAVLVSVLSSRYLNSEWCTREVREFCAGARSRGGLVIDNKSRIFKVIKMPVEQEHSLPPEMHQLLGYEFYTIKDGAPLELDPGYGPEYAQAYKQKVAKLAWDVAQILKALEARQARGGNGNGKHPEAARPTVYLAECSRDRRQARELIEVELTRLGYTVLPDRPLPTDEVEFVAAVKTLLERCALSIHLVGESYGVVPDGPTSKSIVMLQNDLAVDRCRKGKLARLIWLPKGIRSGQAPQQAFIDALLQDAQAQFGADLLTGDIEEFKAAIHSTLKKIEQPEPVQVRPAAEDGTADDKTKLLYLICDEKDRRASVPLRKFCRQQGFEVRLPAFEGDAALVRKTNQQQLASCDAVMLFYGAGDEAWKRSIDNELTKMAGYRQTPVRARGVYLAEPKTRDKDDLIDMDEPGLVNGLAGLPEAALAAFLRAADPDGKP